MGGGSPHRGGQGPHSAVANNSEAQKATASSTEMSQGQSRPRPSLSLSLSLSLSFSFSPPENKDKIVRLLSRALHRIRTTPPRVIASPATREFIPTARRPLGFTSSQNRVAPPWPSSFASFPLQLPPRFPQMLPSRHSVNFLSSTGSRTLPLALKFFSCRETTLLPRTS